MKLRKTRFIVTIIVIAILSSLILKVYIQSRKLKTVEMGEKTLEMYDVYSHDEFDDMFKIDTLEMFFSKEKLDESTIRDHKSIESLSINENGNLYLVNDTHIFSIIIKSQDSIEPEISIAKGNDPVESLEIPYGSSLSGSLKITAFDIQNNVKIDMPFELSHNLEGRFVEDFELTVKATDGINSVTKTLKIKVQPKVEEPLQQPTDTTPNTILITSGLDRLDILVNKKNILPSSFVPKLSYFPAAYSVSDGYRAHPEAVKAYIEMVDTMKTEIGEWMYVTSSYRDYEFQGRLYNNAIKSMGYEKASMLSAKPGASEHQTGLAIDVVTNGVSMYDFGTTKQSKWVSLNAHRFGFIVRYQIGYESITGYNAEPWHLRYLGKDLATSVYNLNVPYENVIGQ